jgi:hypothetical protein
MMRWTTILAVLAGCGGISDDTLLVELTPEDQGALCEDNIGDVETSTVECDGYGEVTVEPVSQSECVDQLDVSDDCAATVGEWLACNDAAFADPCGLVLGEVPTACETYVDCLE